MSGTFLDLVRRFDALWPPRRLTKTGGEGYSVSDELRQRMRSPAVNVDGSPMLGNHDIHGKGYGSGDFGSSEF